MSGDARQRSRLGGSRCGQHRHCRPERPTGPAATKYLLLSKRTKQVFETDAGTAWKQSKRPRSALALEPGELAQTLYKSGDPLALGCWRGRAQQPDGRQLRRLLRARREGPCRRCAREQRDELAPLQLIELHLIPRSIGTAHSRISGSRGSSHSRRTVPIRRSTPAFCHFDLMPATIEAGCTRCGPITDMTTISTSASNARPGSLDCQPQELVIWDASSPHYRRVQAGAIAGF